jgi:uncharacterized repeat protein (TIGR03837 family)
MPTPRWDIFCRVVDNFGDAGVCWRLARILAREHGLAVTLWIDVPAALAHVDPGLDPSRDVQRLAGFTLRRWTEPFPDLSAAEVPDVVVEGFGCGLPDAVVSALAARPAPAAWFILEYLSAESWVDGAHARPSPHPALGLPRRFWFPGFTEASGGLLREAGLLEARRRFGADADAIAALWARLGTRERVPGELRVSMFCYPQAPLAALQAAWATGAAPVTCIAPGPAGTAPAQVRGALTVVCAPFLPPDDYDRLLWACDVNFVRGEDSFVRAQWAGKPLVWQIYAQAEDAHQEKLTAFLDRWCAGLGADAAAAARALFAAWNASPGAPPIGPAWQAYAAARPALAAGATAWALHLARLPELAAGLVTAARRGV